MSLEKKAVEKDSSQFYVFRREGIAPNGEIRFPLVEDFTGEMAMKIERIGKIHKIPKGDDVLVYHQNKARAFQAAEFIREGCGEWGFDDLEVNDFLNWKSNPRDERVNFVSWVGEAWKVYLRAVTNPNYRPGN